MYTVYIHAQRIVLYEDFYPVCATQLEGSVKGRADRSKFVLKLKFRKIRAPAASK